jgi:queuine tRNA-ribosyltransferase
LAILFTITARDAGSRARTGTITTERGDLQTPAFLPVGTAASVKGVWPDQLREMGYGCILSNTYHLYLRPGHARIRTLGGLHRFMGWSGTILTDSGGFQVFSLSALRKVSEDGVSFRSHIDGSLHFLSPELAVEVQEALGSDIRMALDECVELPSGRREAETAVCRTTAWARRGLAAARREEGGQFGIVQGGLFPDLRRRSVEEICALPFAGYAIGGVSVGEGKEHQHDTVAVTAPLLPEEKPRYLMGVGTPEDILHAVSCGVDLFDCVMPTRNARNGRLFTSTGPLSIKQARYADDPAPLDPSCTCPTCRSYSRAYLRHLFLQREILAPMALTVHNLHLYASLMQGIRESISVGNFPKSVKESLLLKAR